DFVRFQNERFCSQRCLRSYFYTVHLVRYLLRSTTRKMTSKPKEKAVDYETLREVDPVHFKYFTQFPLSKPTLNALKTNGFTKLTDVQKLAIKPILLGEDVVVEAATGSGKTLAFLVPMLDRLHTSQVSTLDGPVAVILTPTRELSRQIALVLKRFCTFYKLTMLNIMGGKSSVLKRQEWNTVSRANILIGTPGRLAQHQTENPLLDLSNMQMLILDEADRLLDPTFRGDVDTILNNLTPDRQTLLFSATQSTTLPQLTRLCMRNPVILSTRSSSAGARLPVQLHQSYAVVPLDRKLDVLWTFLQSHCKKKIIVFFSTQKQVRYVYELFQQLRPYFRVLQLRGNMHQPRRFQVYDRFAATPTGCVLLATNVAERGLDFPAVHWVVQYDCPRQLDDYIHRVGRTARIGQTGRAITFLLPSELPLIELLQERGVTPKLQKFPESQINQFASKRAASLLAAKPELATAARAAFTAYLRDYCLGAGSPARHATDSAKVGIASVFNPAALPLGAFAISLGLPSVPELPNGILQWTSPSETKSSHMAEQKLIRDNPWNANTLDKFGSPANEVDEFLVRKPEYVSLSRLQRLETSGAKLLDVVEDTSSSDEASCANEDEQKEELFADVPQPTSIKKSTRVRRAKSELRRKIRTHSKIEFDESGQVSNAVLIVTLLSCV
ncbi:RNA helicase, partial [Paragonimus heterotremus]